MRSSIGAIIRKNSRTREPRPTGWQPMLAQLPGIKAVLFDVYGTLFVSSVHSMQATNLAAAKAFSAALASVGRTGRCTGSAGIARLDTVIRRAHAKARRAGNDHPEIDIRDVWNATLRSLENDGLLDPVDMPAEQTCRLAVEFEWRTNPVWPMPHAAWCLRTLKVAGIQTGLISNAQFFTRKLFPALLGATIAELGISSRLQFYSYQYGAAKPGTHLHFAASAALAKMHIHPNETLCIGNDMLNDVVPAAKLGFRTALFAGDQRSLRWVNCPGWSAVAPDLVLTDLAQLPPCMTSTGRERHDPLPWHNPLWGMHMGRMQLNQEAFGRLR
jgi:putative hydrolase of the HAD superfamily